jgi:hypothetical protein
MHLKNRPQSSIVLSVFSIILSTAAVAFTGINAWKLEQAELSTKISVGMSEADARRLMGEPTYAYSTGDKVIPESVAGFTPDHPLEHRLLIYRRMFDLFVYVFINERGRVVAVYSYRS